MLTVRLSHSGKMIKKLHKNGFFIAPFIVQFCFYHFEGHFPNRLYQGSINFLLITVLNDKGHLSTSAGVWCQALPEREVCSSRPHQDKLIFFENK